MTWRPLSRRPEDYQAVPCCYGSSSLGISIVTAAGITASANPWYRHFAAVGAVAMIMSVAYDPFIQSLVKYTTEYPLVPASTTTKDGGLVAQMSIAKFYNATPPTSSKTTARQPLSVVTRKLN